MSELMKKQETVTISKKQIYIILIISILIVGGAFIYFNFGKLNIVKSFLPEKNIARVNMDEIKESELNNAIKSIQSSGAKLNESEILEQLIDRKLLIQEAEKRGYTATEEEVQEMLEQQLLANGMNLESLREQIGKREYNLVIENYIDQIKITKLAKELKMENNITITDLEGRQFFEENEESFKQIQANVTYEEISEQIKSLLVQREEVSIIQDLIENLRENATISYY